MAAANRRPTAMLKFALPLLLISGASTAFADRPPEPARCPRPTIEVGANVAAGLASRLEDGVRGGIDLRGLTHATLGVGDGFFRVGVFGHGATINLDTASVVGGATVLLEERLRSHASRAGFRWGAGLRVGAGRRFADGDRDGPLLHTAFIVGLRANTHWQHACDAGTTSPAIGYANGISLFVSSDIGKGPATISIGIELEPVVIGWLFGEGL